MSSFAGNIKCFSFVLKTSQTHLMVFSARFNVRDYCFHHDLNPCWWRHEHCVENYQHPCVERTRSFQSFWCQTAGIIYLFIHVRHGRCKYQNEQLLVFKGGKLGKSFSFSVWTGRHDIKAVFVFNLTQKAHQIYTSSGIFAQLCMHFCFHYTQTK